MKNKFFAYAAITLVLFATVGCTGWERTTFQTLAASKATIDQAQVDYEAGAVIPHNLAAYQAINTAKQAQITAVNAMVVYEQLKATGATPTALNTAQVEVVTALSELPSLIVKIKALYIGGK